MMKKTLFGLITFVVVFSMVTGPVLARPFSTLTADQDKYTRNEDVTITYIGLGQDNYDFDARIVILNEVGDIVATDSISGPSGSINYTWIWDQYGNYGAYDGKKVVFGDFELTMGTFYSNGTLIGLFGGICDTFSIGSNGQGPPFIPPGPPIIIPPSKP